MTRAPESPSFSGFQSSFSTWRQARPGTTSDRLVNFVDFGPTLLSLCGVDVPTHMQGQPFLGDQEAEPRKYVHGFRDRMDERYDLLRMTFDGRYRYIRNYHPERPWFHDQYISYLYEMPTMQVWQRLADQGQLTGAQAIFMADDQAHRGALRHPGRPLGGQEPGRPGRASGDPRNASAKSAAAGRKKRSSTWAC